MTYIDDFISDNAGTMTREQIETSLRGAGYDDREIRSAWRRAGQPFSPLGGPGAPPAQAGETWQPDDAAGSGLPATDERDRWLQWWVAFWAFGGMAYWLVAVALAVSTGDPTSFAVSLARFLGWSAIGLYLVLRRRPGRPRGTGVLAIFAPVVLIGGSAVVGGILYYVILALLEALGAA
jgi:hypothetical protein